MLKSIANIFTAWSAPKWLKNYNESSVINVSYSIPCNVAFKKYIQFNVIFENNSSTKDIIWQQIVNLSRMKHGQKAERSLPSWLRWNYKSNVMPAMCGCFGPYLLSPTCTDRESVLVHWLWPSFFYAVIFTLPSYPPWAWQLVQSGYWSQESAGCELEAERRLIVKVMPRKMIDARLGFPVSLSGGRNV